MPWPNRLRTSSRTSSSFSPRFISTWAATPSCSRKQAEQDVLGADVVVVQIAGFFHRVFDDLLGPRRLRQLAHRDHVGPALDELFDFEADFPQVDIEVLEHVGRHAAPFLDEPQQDVLGADVFVVEPLGFLVGQLHHFPGPIRESLVHDSCSPGGCASAFGSGGPEHWLRWIQISVISSAGRENRRGLSPSPQAVLEQAPSIV